MAVIDQDPTQIASPIIGESAADYAKRNPTFSYSSGMDNWTLQQKNGRYVYAPADTPPPAAAPAAPAAPTPAPAPAPAGGGGSTGATYGGQSNVVPPSIASSPALMGLQSAVKATPGPGWQQSQMGPNQQGLGTRTPPMAVDTLRQIVARAGKAY
jgi:hypothetical protein